MSKIVVLINLPKNLNDKIVYLKKRVKKKYGNQIYLSHPPHITLFTFETSSIVRVNKQLKKIDQNISLKKKLLIRTEKIKFFKNDKLTNGTTFFLSIVKNKN